MVSTVMMEKIEDQLKESEKEEIGFLLKHFQSELALGFCFGISILKI